MQSLDLVDSLEEFKEYIRVTLKPHCRKALDDMLVSVEDQIEIIAEQSIHEEELNYATIEGE